MVVNKAAEMATPLMRVLWRINQPQLETPNRCAVPHAAPHPAVLMVMHHTPCVSSIYAATSLLNCIQRLISSEPA